MSRVQIEMVYYSMLNL